MGGKTKKLFKKTKKANKENKNRKLNEKKQNNSLATGKSKKAFKNNKKNLKDVMLESSEESKDQSQLLQQESEDKVLLEPKKRKKEDVESENDSTEDEIEFEEESSGEENDEESSDNIQNGIEPEGNGQKKRKTCEVQETSKMNNSSQSLERNSSEAPQQSTRIFIRGLPQSATVESLTEFFEGHQLKTTDVHLPKFHDGIKGFGFVEFESIGMANTAVGLSDSMFEDSQVSISFAKPKKIQGFDGGNSNETNILFFKGLGFSTTNEDLKKHLKETAEVRLMCHPDGSCKGYAFVEFTSMEAARSAKNRLITTEAFGPEVMIDFASPRGQNRPRNFHDRGGQGFRRGGDRFRGDNRRGSFRGDRGFNRPFRGDRGGHFGNNARGGFSRGDSGRFRGRGSRGGQFRGTRIQFDQD